MSGSSVKCPKCNSHMIDVMKNQERICRKCGYVFYFVTPNCGTQLDLSRYDLKKSELDM